MSTDYIVKKTLFVAVILAFLFSGIISAKAKKCSGGPFFVTETVNITLQRGKVKVTDQWEACNAIAPFNSILVPNKTIYNYKASSINSNKKIPALKVNINGKNGVGLFNLSNGDEKNIASYRVNNVTFQYYFNVSKRDKFKLQSPRSRFNKGKLGRRINIKDGNLSDQYYWSIGKVSGKQYKEIFEESRGYSLDFFNFSKSKGVFIDNSTILFGLSPINKGPFMSQYREIKVTGKVLEVERHFKWYHSDTHSVKYNLEKNNTVLDHELYHNGELVLEESLATGINGEMNLTKGDKWILSYKLPQRINCKPNLSLISAFPFQKCNFEVYPPTWDFPYTIKAKVSIPDSYVIEEGKGSSLFCANTKITKNKSRNCSIVQNGDFKSPKVGIENQNRKFVVFGPIYSTQWTLGEKVRNLLGCKDRGNSCGLAAGCLLELTYRPSFFYWFIFGISLIGILISSLTPEKPRNGLGICFTIWTFQEALVPLNGLERPLSIALYDLTILPGIIIVLIRRFKDKLTKLWIRSGYGRFTEKKEKFSLKGISEDIYVFDKGEDTPPSHGAFTPFNTIIMEKGLFREENKEKMGLTFFHEVGHKRIFPYCLMAWVLIFIFIPDSLLTYTGAYIGAGLILFILLGVLGEIYAEFFSIKRIGRKKYQKIDKKAPNWFKERIYKLALWLFDKLD